MGKYLRTVRACYVSDNVANCLTSDQRNQKKRTELLFYLTEVRLRENRLCLCTSTASLVEARYQASQNSSS